MREKNSELVGEIEIPLLRQYKGVTEKCYSDRFAIVERYSQIKAELPRITLLPSITSIIFD